MQAAYVSVGDSDSSIGVADTRGTVPSPPLVGTVVVGRRDHAVRRTAADCAVGWKMPTTGLHV